MPSPNASIVWHHAVCLTACLFCFACAAPTQSQPADSTSPLPVASPSSDTTDQPRIAMSVIADRAAVKPGGSFTLLLRCAVAKSWHTYWPGINDTGAPPTIDLSLPKGWTSDPPRWPPPTRHVSGGDLLDHVLDREFGVLIAVHAPVDARADVTHTIRVGVDWLVCDRVCLMQQTKGALTIRTSTIEQVNTVGLEQVDSARARLPAPFHPPATAAITDRVLRIQWPGATRLSFYPADTGATYFNLIRNGSRRGDSLAISFDAGDARSIEGVVDATWLDTGTTHTEQVTISMPLSVSTAPPKQGGFSPDSPNDSR